MIRTLGFLLLAGIALGLAACGGSDDRGDTAGATRDPGRSSSAGPGDRGLDTENLLPPGDPRMKDLDYLRTLDPSPDVQIAIGTALMEQGEADSALVAYRDATRMAPKDPRAWTYYGIALKRLGRIEDAEKAYLRAIAEDAFYPKSHVNLGNIYYSRDQMTRAIQEYRLATTIDSTDAATWWNLGLAYEKEGQTNPAILAYKKVVECDPEDPRPFERLGWIYYERKLYKAACDRWADYLAIDPSREDLRDNIKRLQAYRDSTGTR